MKPEANVSISNNAYITLEINILKQDRSHRQITVKMFIRTIYRGRPKHEAAKAVNPEWFLYHFFTISLLSLYPIPLSRW